jgi:hypothetical protein
MSPPIPIKKLSRAEGEKILDLARETSAVRYSRAAHGFTYGDASRVVKADLGRGTEAFVASVFRPSIDVPLRAYHAVMIFKTSYLSRTSKVSRCLNGWRVGSICITHFAMVKRRGFTRASLRLMRQLFGVTVFSIDPYQVGHENEEGIESGAFWF